MQKHNHILNDFRKYFLKLTTFSIKYSLHKSVPFQCLPVTLENVKHSCLNNCTADTKKQNKKIVLIIVYLYG